MTMEIMQSLEIMQSRGE